MKTEEKWPIVKSFYEKNYKVKFFEKIPDDKIEFLFNQMNTYHRSVNEFFEKGRPVVQHWAGE